MIHQPTNSNTTSASRNLYAALGFRQRLILTLATLGAFAVPLPAYAWGERGHDTVTRVATRLLQDNPKAQPLAKVLTSKEHMLAHYSNVPDIIWRSGPDHVRQANSPTHFLDLEFLLTPTYPVAWSALPLTLDQARKRLEQNCREQKTCPKGKTTFDKFQKVGTAPWRIQQLLTAMQQELAAAAALEKQGISKKNRPAYTKHVDQALLYGGLASHFVGDLANPHHCTRNYNGHLTGNGGIHSYFETAVVNSYPLGLAAAVWQQAREHPHQSLQASLVAKPPATPDALDHAWYLILESFQDNPEILSLDDRHAISKRSKGKSDAQRLPPGQTSSKFQPIIVKRLARGAETLAQLWFQAWLAAGSPQLSSYKSYHYEAAPAFVEPQYTQALR